MQFIGNNSYANINSFDNSLISMNISFENIQFKHKQYAEKLIKIINSKLKAAKISLYVQNICYLCT